MIARHVDLKLGYTCNNDCIHCVIATQRKHAILRRGDQDRVTRECIEELSDIARSGCLSVVLTGGEPTIRNDFLEIARYAKSLGLTVSLQTNGRRFRDEAFANETVRYVDFFVVALHGATARTHDKITHAPGSFADTVLGLKNLLRRTTSVSGKTVISKHNINDLSSLACLFSKTGVSRLNMAFPHIAGNAASHFLECVPTYAQVRPHLEQCIAVAESLRLQIDFEAVLPCLFDHPVDVRYFSDLKISGKVSEVRQLDEGCIEYQTARRSTKRKGAICSQCRFDRICEGYWMEYVETIGFDEFRPVSGQQV